MCIRSGLKPVTDELTGSARLASIIYEQRADLRGDPRHAAPLGRTGGGGGLAVTLSARPLPIEILSR